MPKSGVMGPLFGAIGLALAFALVWHIWWMVIVFLVAAVVTMMVHGFSRNTERIVPAQQVQQAHHRWLDAVAAAPPTSHPDEANPLNPSQPVTRFDGGPASSPITRCYP